MTNVNGIVAGMPKVHEVDTIYPGAYIKQSLGKFLVIVILLAIVII